ncbi:DUF4422 domain-containing protein [Desulfitobacterium hafniense]|nr:DUF4422 domain-containing protein [Desulfitobacterium hafniense]
MMEKIQMAKRIAVYGAQATACGVVLSLIVAFKRVPEAVIVSDMSGNPEEIFGVSVIPIENAQNLKDCLILVATPIYVHNEIMETLYANGFQTIIPIANELEYEIMAAYYRGATRFDLLEDIPQSGGTPDIGIFRVCSARDAIVKEALLTHMREFVTNIQAGAAISGHMPGVLTDDVGENISERNSRYSELTATYWVWKHVTTAFKGIYHYRRLLHLTEADLLRLNHLDAVLPLPMVKYPNASAQFKRYISNDTFEVIMGLLKSRNDDYYAFAHQYWYEPYLYNYNMLIARAQVFDDYCSFLFDILFKVEHYFDSRRIPKQERYIGYIGEILTSLYFMANSHLKIGHTRRTNLI